MCAVQPVEADTPEPRAKRAFLPTGVSGPTPRMCWDPRDNRSYHEARRLKDATIQPGAASNRLDWCSAHPDFGAGLDNQFQMCACSTSTNNGPRRAVQLRNFPRMNFGIYFACEDMEDLMSATSDMDRDTPVADLGVTGLDGTAAVSTKRMDFAEYFGDQDIEAVLERFTDAEIAAAAGEDVFPRSSCGAGA